MRVYYNLMLVALFVSTLIGTLNFIHGNYFIGVVQTLGVILMLFVLTR